LRYDSPALHGFIFSASVSESSGGLVGGTNWGAMLRYAGEHHGFRIAAGVGFDHTADVFTNNTVSAQNLTPAVVPSASPAVQSIIVGATPYGRKTPDIDAWGVGLSAMHVSSGLFLQGSYQAVQYNNLGSSTTGYWGEACDGSTGAGTSVNGTTCKAKNDAHWWQIQGGIAKNWTGWGNTILYGEYGRHSDWGAELGGRDFTSSISTVAAGFGQLSNVRSTEATVWGLGIVQNFNNAATEWYLGYRNFALDLNSDAVCTRGANPNIATNAPAGAGTCSISDMNLIVTGLRVKF
jgi:hypothetical protein